MTCRKLVFVDLHYHHLEKTLRFTLANLYFKIPGPRQNFRRKHCVFFGTADWQESIFGSKLSYTNKLSTFVANSFLQNIVFFAKVVMAQTYQIPPKSFRCSFATRIYRSVGFSLKTTTIFLGAFNRQKLRRLNVSCYPLLTRPAPLCREMAMSPGRIDSRPLSQAETE